MRYEFGTKIVLKRSRRSHRRRVRNTSHWSRATGRKLAIRELPARATDWVASKPNAVTNIRVLPQTNHVRLTTRRGPPLRHRYPTISTYKISFTLHWRDTLIRIRTRPVTGRTYCGQLISKDKIHCSPRRESLAARFLNQPSTTTAAARIRITFS